MGKLINLKFLLMAAFVSGAGGISFASPLAKPVEGNLQGKKEKASGETELNATPDLNRFYSKFALLGTVVGDRGPSFAVIEDRELRSQRIYRVGHPIQGGIVAAILKDQVVIRFGPDQAVLKIGGSTGSTAATGGVKTREIERRFVTLSLHGLRNIMEEFNQSGSKTRIVPNPPGMGADGLRLVGVDAESALGTMGLKSGDVIEAINGKPIQDPYNAVAMYNLMKSVLPEDKFNEMGLDLAGFLDGINNHRWSLYQKMFSLLQKNKDIPLTLTVKRKETKP
jgi:type II secretory pathway component PulC